MFSFKRENVKLEKVGFKIDFQEKLNLLIGCTHNVNLIKNILKPTNSVMKMQHLIFSSTRTNSFRMGWMNSLKK